MDSNGKIKCASLHLLTLAVDESSVSSNPLQLLLLSAVAFLMGIVVSLLFQFTFLNDMVPSMVFICSSATYFIFFGVVLF